MSKIESGPRAVWREPAPLAPAWHSAALIAVIVAVALTGAALSRTAPDTLTPPPAAGSRIGALYLPMLAVQGALLFYVCRVGRPRNAGALAALLGRRWSSARRALGDLGLACAAFAIIEGCEHLYSRVLDVGRNAAVQRVLPHTGVEQATWLLVAVGVGFCEEVVYRGYLITQLTAFTRRTWFAILFQALLFGIAHGEQGLAASARLGFYGLLLGILATRRGSLLPGIVCHIVIDLTSGLSAGGG